VTATIDGVDVSVFTIPTDAPESDGTFEWDSTTAVVVQARAGDAVGTGYTYAHQAAAVLIEDVLGPVVVGRSAMAVRRRWQEMATAVRNIRLPGIAAYAISALDTALWDLKARLLGVALVDVLDAPHAVVPAYGSGGFTSYDIERLQEQLGGWIGEGFTMVKMKVGRDPGEDVGRVVAAREAIGPDAELFVDANGALRAEAALAFAHEFRQHGVTWFEEPVSSDDTDGLRHLRRRVPAGMEVTAGEYGTHLPEFRRLLDAGAVDCLQVDVTRCGGITPLLVIAAHCEMVHIDVSAHTAPQMSAHAFAAVRRLRHIEWFHDHVRVERLLFDGTLDPVDGLLRPDGDRQGHGLTLRTDAPDRYRID
jgi:L-alanine-DL-glutamate epimerase-like enolase superfamily enzyme